MRLTDSELIFDAETALRSHDYASQTTGWRITRPGAADFRYLYADEMHVKAFIADLEMALAGGQIITKSVTLLSFDMTVPNYGASVYMVVDAFKGFPNAYVFSSGDTIGIKVLARTDGTASAPGSLTVGWVFGTVSNPVIDTTNKRQGWTFTRLGSGTINGMAAGGTLSAGTVIEAGAVVLDFGTNGNGYMETNAIDGQMGANSPYVQAVTWNAHPVYDRAIRGRFGNLAGITDPNMSVSGFGIFTDNGYYRGVLVAANGTVVIDHNGPTVALPSNDFSAVQSYNFVDGAVDAGGIYGYYSSSHYTIYVRAIGNTSKRPLAGLTAISPLSSGAASNSLVYIAAANNLKTANITLDVTPTTATTTFGGDEVRVNCALMTTSVRPQAHNTYSIGESINRYHKLYANEIDIVSWGTWVSVTFNTGWGDFGSGYQTIQYRKTGDTVQMRGLCYRFSGSSPIICTLPSGYRPPYREVFVVMADGAAGRLDVTTAGEMTLVAGTTGYVSLSGIRFSVL
jgi:hypothetical protein